MPSWRVNYLHVYGLKWATLAAEAAWQRGIGMVPHKPEFRWLGSSCAAGAAELRVGAIRSRASDVGDLVCSNATCPFEQAPVEEGEE